MARIFRQKDIIEMEAAQLSDDFVNYYNRLSEIRRQEIAELRPDLVEEIERRKQQDLQNENNAEPPIHEEKPKNLPEESKAPAAKTEEDEFAQIRRNAYEAVDLAALIRNDMQPLETLAIKNDPKVCYLHHTPVEKRNIVYHAKGGAVVGVAFYLCPLCKRLYIEEAYLQSNRQKLAEYGIPHTIYDLELTNRYLRSQMQSYELGEEETVRVVSTWVEENPQCPIHKTSLQPIPCVKKDGENQVAFTGYLCDSCNGLLLRRSDAVDLEDICAEQGVPQIHFEKLERKKIPPKVKPKQLSKPDVFVQDGEILPYEFDFVADCDRLTKKDTVIVSDSIYCSLEGHDSTTEVLGLIPVQEKAGKKRNYLFRLGYCTDCQKYYVEETDYKPVYQRGHLETTVLLDVEESDYLITSGEVFDLEEKHLDSVEKEIHGEMNEIKKQPDYVSQYATGAYDDGNLKYSKKVSKEKYEPRLAELYSYTGRPYDYRVDLKAEGQTEVYYVGGADIVLGATQHVISANSRFGRELVHYQTQTILKDGKRYHIKLSRQFDIEKEKLYGYANLRTDEDIIFRKGITDPFLVKVLSLRKKQHNLIDIFVTIQENQNAIVDAPFKRNLIVQGCAGSGKTMVLLHRLSSLKYNEVGFDFRNAVILTPNEQFNLHIQGLADGLQIGSIRRRSVERYYAELLEEYSSELRVPAALQSEMAVRQSFVDYVYSDAFLLDFDTAYKKVIAQRNLLCNQLEQLIQEMGGQHPAIDLRQDDQVIPQLTKSLQTLEELVQFRNRDAESAEKRRNQIQERLAMTAKAVPETIQKLNEAIDAAQVQLYGLIQTKEVELQHVIDDQNLKLQQLDAEEESIRKAMIPFGKQRRIQANREKYQQEQAERTNAEQSLEKWMRLGQTDLSNKTREEVLTWLTEVADDLPEMMPGIRTCKGLQQRIQRLAEENSQMKEQVDAAEERYQHAVNSKFSPKIEMGIQMLKRDVQAYTVRATCQMVFDEAVTQFVEDHQIGRIQGRNHRYDLYAALIFAMRYFDRQIGTERFLCVDEGQDLAPNEYRLLSEVNRNEVIFNIYGDTNQLIKPGRGIQAWSQLESVFDANLFTLNENYRNTNQITRFCNDSFQMNVLETGVDGPRVREIARKELEPELEKLTDSRERIAVLLPRGIVKRQYIKRERLTSATQDKIQEDMQSGCIAVMYVDEVKGIEFDRVFVSFSQMSENERYIAYTRALSQLVLVADERNSRKSDMDVNTIAIQ